MGQLEHVITVVQVRFSGFDQVLSHLHIERWRRICRTRGCLRHGSGKHVQRGPHRPHERRHAGAADRGDGEDVRLPDALQAFGRFRE